MFTGLLIFSLLAYGLAFLVADAKIFGCPATDFYQDSEDYTYIRSAGILPLRQIVMRWRWCSRVVHALLTCYFCLGVWCGGLIHLSLVGLFQLEPSVPLLSSYPVLSRTLWGTVICTVMAAILGGGVCYLLELLIQLKEHLIGILEHRLDLLLLEKQRRQAREVVDVAPDIQ